MSNNKFAEMPWFEAEREIDYDKSERATGLRWLGILLSLSAAASIAMIVGVVSAVVRFL